MNPSFYLSEAQVFIPFSGDEASQDFTFNSSMQAQDHYMTYLHSGYSDVHMSAANSSTYVPHPHGIVHMDTEPPIPSVQLVSMTGPIAYPSGSPASAVSSQPTPAQILQMFDKNVGPGISNESLGTCAPVDGGSLTIEPSALHTPHVSPVHSRHGSFQVQTGYDQGHASSFISADAQAFYSSDSYRPCSSSNQYSAPFTSATPVISEPFTPPLAIAPTLIYSPSHSRRPSFQPTTEQSPPIVQVNLTSYSPAVSPYIGHAHSPSTCSRHSDREDSGTSSYSPYSHGRTLSSSTEAFSPVNIPATPHIRNGSLSAPSPCWSADSSGLLRGGLNGFPLESWIDPVAPGKKRKRRSLVGVESEDEYTGGTEDTEASDEDYCDEFGAKKGKSRIKRGKRVPKRQKLFQGAMYTSVEDVPLGAYATNHPNQATACGPLAFQGTEIKVKELIPITRETQSCPHCGFIPGNRRFSDLKRHWEAHLDKDAKEKPRWVCLDCGDVEEVIVEAEGEDGIKVLKSIREYVKRAASKVYTRKDSARRHWRQDHGEKGNAEWREGLITQVDRVRDDGHDDNSSSEA